MKDFKVKKGLNAKEGKGLEAFHPVLAHLLFHRGFKDAEEISDFLNPSYEKHIHDPYLFKDMEKAVNRVISAIEKGEKIGIYSDYDADGIPGAVIMSQFLDSIGHKKENSVFHIPHREDDGFGLHEHLVEGLYEKGVRLLITIDCGVVDYEAVNKANELGMEVIITDHHLPQDGKLPNAFAIINPQLPDAGYPFKSLCGSGVAFKLIQGILKKKDFGMNVGQEKWLLDMVGLATLSDMVPLLGENRALAHFGLKVLRKTRRPGLRKLFYILGINERNLTEDDVTFSITPRINAASRMGAADHAFNLLTAKTEKDGDTFARILEKINTERKGTTAGISKHVRKILESKKTSGDMGVVIVAGSYDWKPSLLGPVANNLIDEYDIPVFLWGKAGDVIKGSCRAPIGFNILKILEAIPSGILIEFGGHKGSGGYSLHEDKILVFEKELAIAIQKIGREDLALISEIDAELKIGDINEKLFSEINLLSPFGMDNPKPVFLLKSVTVDAVKIFGKTKEHLEFTFVDSEKNKIKGILFFALNSGEETEFKKGDKVNVIFNLEKNNFRGASELRLRILEVL